MTSTWRIKGAFAVSALMMSTIACENITIYQIQGEGECEPSCIGGTQCVNGRCLNTFDGAMADAEDTEGRDPIRSNDLSSLNERDAADAQAQTVPDADLDQPDQNNDVGSGGFGPSSIWGTISIASVVQCTSAPGSDCKGGIGAFAFPCADFNCIPVGFDVIQPADLSQGNTVNYLIPNLIHSKIWVGAYLLETQIDILEGHLDVGDLWGRSLMAGVDLLPGKTSEENIILNRNP
jgi:hypothetical protein